MTAAAATRAGQPGGGYFRYAAMSQPTWGCRPRHSSATGASHHERTRPPSAVGEEPCS